MVLVPGRYWWWQGGVTRTRSEWELSRNGLRSRHKTHTVPVLLFWNASLRTPLKRGRRFFSQDPVLACNFNKDTSVIWTLPSVPLVSGLEEFQCITVAGGLLEV